MKLNIIKFLLKISLLTSFLGCKLEKDENIDAGVVNDEIRNRKPVRITAGEVLSACNEFGMGLADLISNQIDYCSDKNKITTLLPDSLKVFCKSVRAVCDETQAVYQKEKMLFSAYQQSQDEISIYKGNLQPINDSTTLYTYGIKGGMITFELDRHLIAKTIYRKKTEPKNWFKKKS